MSDVVIDIAKFRRHFVQQKIGCRKEKVKRTSKYILVLIYKKKIVFNTSMIVLFWHTFDFNKACHWQGLFLYMKKFGV